MSRKTSLNAKEIQDLITDYFVNETQVPRWCEYLLKTRN